MKKIICLLAVMAFAVGFVRVSALTAGEAVQIEPQVTDGAGNRLWELEDANRNSKRRLDAQTLTITGTQEFCGVYLIWDRS